MHRPPARLHAGLPASRVSVRIPTCPSAIAQLWDVPTYRKQNKFCSTACVVDLIDALPESSEKTALQACAAKISQEYDALSQKYHAEKASNPANSITFS